MRITSKLKRLGPKRVPNEEEIEVEEIIRCEPRNLDHRLCKAHKMLIPIEICSFLIRSGRPESSL